MSTGMQSKLQTILLTTYSSMDRTIRACACVWGVEGGALGMPTHAKDVHMEEMGNCMRLCSYINGLGLIHMGLAHSLAILKEPTPLNG